MRAFDGPPPQLLVKIPVVYRRESFFRHLARSEVNSVLDARSGYT